MEVGDKVEQEEKSCLVQRVEDFVDAGGRELSEGADGVELLVVDSIAYASVFLRNRYYGARVRRGGVLDEPGRKVLVDDGIWRLAHARVRPVGAGGDRGAVRRHGDLERNQGARYNAHPI